MAKNKELSIVERVRFWEEQDKINQALIPRVMEMHEVVRNLHKQTSDISGQIAAAEARVLQHVRSQLQSAPGTERIIAYAALALSVLACAFSLYKGLV